MSTKKAPKGPPPPITPVGSGTCRVQPPQKPETPEQFDRKGSLDYYGPRWRVAKQYAASPEESRSLTLALEYVNRIGKPDGGPSERTDTDKQWIHQFRAQLDSALDCLNVPASDPIRPARMLGEAVAGADLPSADHDDHAPWIRESDRQMAKTKMADPARHPFMSAKETAAALDLSKSAVYDHPLLERVGSGTSKVRFTTKSVLAVKNSRPD